MDLRDRFTEMREMDLQVQSTRCRNVTASRSAGSARPGDAREPRHAPQIGRFISPSGRWSAEKKVIGMDFFGSDVAAGCAKCTFKVEYGVVISQKTVY